jgi:HEAT repeats
MKGSQRNQKALALVTFGIFLAGLTCYWLKHNRAPRAAGYKPGSSRYFFNRGTPPVRKDLTRSARSFEHQTFSWPDRSSTQEPIEETIPPRTLHAFPSANHTSHTAQEIKDTVNELEISGTSQTSAELVQEITTRSDSKAELFSRARSLGLRHPDSKIREQALTYLAELDNDLAINSVIEALIDPEPRIRQVAREALYRLGNRVPVQPLIELAARSGNAALQAEVVAFIERFADRAAILQMTEQFQK